jgi:hypothetical protein
MAKIVPERNAPVRLAVICAAVRGFTKEIPDLRHGCALKLRIPFVKLPMGGLPLPAFPP